MAEERALSRQEKIWKGTGVFWYAIRPLLLYLLLPSAISGLVVVITKSKGNLDRFVQNSGQFYRTLGIVLTFYLLRRRCKKRGETIWNETGLYVRDISLKKMALLLAAGAGFSLFISAVLTVIPFPRFLISPYRAQSSEIYGRVDTGLAILSVMLLAPVVEEMIFRGYVLNRLLQGYGSTKAAVLICTAIFAFCHGTPLWMIYAVVMGLLMAHVSLIEDNIIYSIAFHMGYNAVTLPLWIVNRSEQLSGIFFASPVLISVYGIIGIATALLCMRAYPMSIHDLTVYLPRLSKKEEIL